MAYLVGETGYLYVLFFEESAADVGEHGQRFHQVGVALLQWCIQHLEQSDECRTRVLGIVFRQIVVEHVVLAKHARVFAIEAEHQPHTQYVKALQRMGIRGIYVLLQQFLVYLAHHLAGFHRNFHLLREVLALFVDEELQAIVFLAQVLEQYLLRLAVGVLHVVDQELLKVAGHNPPRMLRYGHADHIAACLLEGWVSLMASSRTPKA